MLLNNIRLIQFRNYEAAEVIFSERWNIFYGRNAQGKTNLLEAVYFACKGRSFRTARDRELIHLDKKQAYLSAEMQVGEFEKKVEIKLDRHATKRIKVNGKEIRNFKNLYSGMSVVCFYPEDLNLVKGGPSLRRDFLDDILSEIKPMYSHYLSKYEKILMQRNNLLKYPSREGLHLLLDTYDIQLAESGSQILWMRQAYVEKLESLAREILEEISDDSEHLKLIYSHNVEGERGDLSALVQAYLRSMKQNRNRDRELYSTEIGPHRDDVLIEVNEKNLKLYGSQGQQRSVVLALKLAHLRLIREERGLLPILLLDDVFSELDADRKQFLKQSLRQAQVFLATSDLEEVRSLKSEGAKLFEVREGTLSEELLFEKWNKNDTIGI